MNRGYNDYGQLGLGHQTSQTLPVLITHLDNIFICRVVCGYNHTMVLSDEGKVYMFGQCDRGQLGTGGTTLQTIPVQLDNSFGRFLDIASNRATNISAAITLEGRCYVWGECQLLIGNVLKPLSKHLIIAFK
jgi:alpha-tubulin suppressor-like RCC1 family protein